MLSETIDIWCKTVQILKENNIFSFSLEKNRYPKNDAFHKLLRDKGANNDLPDIFIPEYKIFIRFYAPTEDGKNIDKVLKKWYSVVEIKDYKEIYKIIK